jgi:putative Mg2+ transporter-C (MgtC) family protein
MNWWDTAIRTISNEFSDVPDAEQFTRLLVRLLVAAVLGGMLGMQRERHGKAAGVRTHMLVALGAALFVLVPMQAGMASEDLSRVVQGVVAGVGFLCAGSILKSGDDHVRGLTTAAGIWLTAAIGLAAGMGREMTAALSALLALAILSMEGPLRRLAGRADNDNEDPG